MQIRKGKKLFGWKFKLSILYKIHSFFLCQISMYLEKLELSHALISVQNSFAFIWRLVLYWDLQTSEIPLNNNIDWLTWKLARHSSNPVMWGSYIGEGVRRFFVFFFNNSQISLFIYTNSEVKKYTKNISENKFIKI